MAYLGQGPFQEFTNPPTKDSFTGDGSTTTFDLAATVPSNAQNALEVYVDNVRQEPGTGKAFTLGVDGSNDHKRITFSSAPASGASIYVINDKTNTSITAPLQNDLNGTELILDGDGDTSITADSDDRIDFKIGGTDHFHITSSSSDTVIQNKVDAKDFLFNQYDGRTILEINDAGYVALANGATGSGELRIYEDTDNGTNYTGFKVGAQSADIDYVLPTADGSSGQALVTNGSGVLSFAAAGAITSYTNSTNNRIVTSVDSSTVNSEANLTFDGSALQVTGTLTVGADDTGHDVIFYGATASANMTWDESVDDLILNGAARIVIPDGQLVLGSTAVTSTAAELNLLDGVSGLVQADFTKLAAVDSTAAELNIVDGGTSATSTTVADADRVVMNDNGTMVQVAVTDLAAYFDDEITAMPNLVTTAATTVGALDSGSITSGFGNIDNGASNITSGGLVKLDVDADADDVSGDSATGRLTLGAGEDLNFYHGGTNSYIVNDTGDLILKTGASDEDMIFQGNDGGAAITALTLDMSAAGAAAFNSTVTATGFIIGSANINEAELEIIDGATITTTELNLIDGDTARGTTAVASGDGILINDAGTMRMTNVDTVSTYFSSHNVGGGNIVTVGALDSGSITSGFTSIDVGAGAITTTGVITGGTVEATTDTAANDNAAMGYTAAEGLILTGQGSTNDVTIKNDADADVIEIPTGTTNVTVAGNLGVGGTAVANTDTDTSNTGNVTLDFAANQNFVLTLTGNTTLVNPTTEQVGQSGFIAFIQDGTGSRTVSLGTDYETAASAGLTLTSTASATDLVPYLVVAAGRILLGTPQLSFG
jgi:hypothetical protein